MGCFQSHVHLYKFAHQHDMEYIGIAEDNSIHMHDTLPASVVLNVNQLLPTQDWDLILLGGWFIPFSRYTHTSYPSLYKTTSIHGTSCYIIHKRLYTKILATYEHHLDKHIDAYLMNQSASCYMVSPLLFRRNNTIPTSNTYFSNAIVNAFYYINCSRTATLMWEFYSIHSLTILTIALLILLIVLLYWLYRNPLKKSRD